jgi:flagellin
MTVINTNIKSLISQNAMIKNNRELSSAMQQLSTGKRINSAKDDAAGLAITSRMTAQIRGLDQAVRNGNDSISMLQTTEGAMIEMTNMMQRMRELAIQSSNDTYTASDRGYMDLEFQQLKTEVNRITKDTEWNGMNIMDGSVVNDDNTVGKFEFQVGANQGQIITHTIPDMGFRDAQATLTTPTPNAVGVSQISKLNLSGTFVEGDIVSVTIGGVAKSYTVLAADVASGNKDAILAAVTTKLATAIGTPIGGATVTSSSGVITFTAATAGTGFTTASSKTLAKDTGALTNIRDLDIKTNLGSNASISQLDISIDRINTERAGIGAVVNRLNYAVDNLTNVAQNTTESRSRILDADYAKASSELARTQIISQAATAMLAQANQQPQTVMKLLQG